MDLSRLSRYAREDTEKRQVIDDILLPNVECCYSDISHEKTFCLESPFRDIVETTKYCPKCGREFPEIENFCFNCGQKLKDIKNISVKDIEFRPEFRVEKEKRFDGFEDIFVEDNLDRIARFDFKVRDFKAITSRIKVDALRCLDDAIKANEIRLDSLNISDKVLLFSRAFVEVDYKAYGGELGYFEFNRIYVDDRQPSALKITTLLHELSHFLLKEIIAQIICELLDCTKTAEIEAISVFILSYSPINQLIDEYAAHTVEGRFTLFGYQDYSSYLSIEKTIDLPPDEIEMLKTIGNSLSVHIKDILESFIDEDLLEEIKEQFTKDVRERPNYECLALENCTLLNNTGLIQALKWVIAEGFMISMDSTEKLEGYRERFE